LVIKSSAPIPIASTISSSRFLAVIKIMGV